MMKAAEKMTRSVFKIFEIEFAHSLNEVITSEPEDPFADVLEYKVATQPYLNRDKVVHFDMYSYKAKCSCHMWETEGIICSHIIKVFAERKVLHLPEWCILRRWSKDAKHRLVDELDQASAEPAIASLSGLAFVNRMMRLVYEISNDSRDDEDCRALCLKQVYALKGVVQRKLHGRPPKLPSCSESRSMNDTPFSDPRPSKRRLHGNTVDRSPTTHWSTQKGKKIQSTKPKTNSVNKKKDVRSAVIASSPINSDLPDEAVLKTGEQYVPSQKSMTDELMDPFIVAEPPKTGEQNIPSHHSSNFDMDDHVHVAELFKMSGRE